MNLARFRPLARSFFVALFVVGVVGSSTSCAQSTPHGKADDLFEAMQIEEGDWAADVGSGDGDYTLHMVQVVGNSGRVFAVDIDPSELEELNDEVKNREIENLTTVYSVHDNPMLPAQSLDAVLVRNAYHEFTAFESMLQRIKEALKPGGRLVLEESVSHDMVGKSRKEQTESHDIGKEYVRKELEENGFHIEEARDPFVKDDSHRHWLLVATRPDS